MCEWDITEQRSTAGQAPSRVRIPRTVVAPVRFSAWLSRTFPLAWGCTNRADNKVSHHECPKNRQPQNHQPKLDRLLVCMNHAHEVSAAGHFIELTLMNGIDRGKPGEHIPYGEEPYRE